MFDSSKLIKVITPQLQSKIKISIYPVANENAHALPLQLIYPCYIQMPSHIISEDGTNNVGATIRYTKMFLISTQYYAKYDWKYAINTGEMNT